MNLIDLFKPRDGEADLTAGIDPTELLKKDHDKVRAQFTAYRGLQDSDYEEKARIFSEINRELSIHARIEEEIFYPAVKKVDSEDAPQIVLEAIEEHDIVKTLLGQLRGIEPTDETFDAKMTVLMEGVEHHAEEEEDDMFPEARELDRDTLHDLGNRLLLRKAHFEQIFEDGKLMNEAEAIPAPASIKKAASAPSKRRASATKATGKKAAAGKKSRPS